MRSWIEGPRRPAQSPHGRGFERYAHLQNVGGFAGRYRHDDGTLAGQQIEQILCRQPKKCFVHRSPADPELRGHLDLAQQLPATHLAGQNPGLGLLIGTFTRGRIGSRHETQPTGMHAWLHATRASGPWRLVVASQAAVLQLPLSTSRDDSHSGLHCCRRVFLITPSAVTSHLAVVPRTVAVGPPSWKGNVRTSVEDRRAPTLSDHDRFGKDSWTPLVCCGASI